jgi:uncharacterized membrane protein YbhN (UPF0104 family)
VQALTRFLRRSWPWLVGIGILVVVVTRVPGAAFREGLGKGPHLALAAVNLAIVGCVLCTDSVATWVGLVAVRLRRPFGDVAAVRGATYALFVVNYAVGQGAFGYYLHKTGISGPRATGATLFLIGTNFAGLLILTTIAVFADPVALPTTHLQTTLEIGCIALVAYLAVIAWSPALLADRALLAPLFEAGLRGHALAIVARVPHVTVMVLGQWAALRVWGVMVPLEAGLVTLPIVVIASVLPISPAGLGTTQAALVYLFSGYAAGASLDDRQGAILAFAIVHFVYGVLASLLVGVACMPVAKRRDVLRRPDTGIRGIADDA